MSHERQLVPDTKLLSLASRHTSWLGHLLKCRERERERYILVANGIRANYGAATDAVEHTNYAT